MYLQFCFPEEILMKMPVHFFTRLHCYSISIITRTTANLQLVDVTCTIVQFATCWPCFEKKSVCGNVNQQQQNFPLFDLTVTIHLLWTFQSKARFCLLHMMNEFVIIIGLPIPTQIANINSFMHLYRYNGNLNMLPGEWQNCINVVFSGKLQKIVFFILIRKK